MVCVGGYDGERRLSEVWRLGCEYEQENLPLKGDELVGRAGHCMARVGEHSYVVASGIYYRGVKRFAPAAPTML